MFIDRTIIRNTLFGLVGFKQTDNPDYDLLNASLLTSRSGRIVNDEHGLLNIENIDQTSRNFSLMTYPAFAIGTEYSLGDMVAESGVNYSYINAAASTGNTPPNATYWAVINNISDYLIAAQKKGIDNTIDAILGDKKIRGRIKSIYDNVLLYDGLANYSSLVANEDKFVGLRIRLKKDRSLISIINKIGTQFSTVLTGNLTLSLYHSSQQTKLSTFTIEPHTEGLSSKWTAFAASNILRYLDDSYDAGGDFYLGYKQSDLAALGGQALKMDITWGESCGCNDRSDRHFKNYSPYVDVTGFRILETAMVSDKLFNPALLEIVKDNNFGINLNLSQKCDLTNIVLQEEELMAEAVSLQTAMYILDNMANNTRGTNALANLVKKEADRQLFHHKDAWGTIADKASRATKALSFDWSDLNDDCMPKEGVRVKIGSRNGRLI